MPALALAPFLLVLASPTAAGRAGRLGLVHGFVAWVVAIPWIVPTLITYGGLPAWVAAVLLAVLAAYLALFHAGFAWAAARLCRKDPALGPVTRRAVPALWLIFEGLRAVALGGFPWNPAAHVWVALPGALPLSAWIGAWGVSFLVVLVNTAIAALARRPGPGRSLITASVGLALPVAALVAGARWSGGAALWSGSPVEVRVLQPNIQNLVVPDPSAVAANYSRVLAMANRACDRDGVLLVWPESAAWPYSLERTGPLRADVLALAARGCPVLLNSARFEGEAVFNAAYLVGGRAAASIDAADKRHLVPFGEYVPLRRVLPFAGTLARNAGEFSPAREVRLLDWGAQRLGLAICFEVIFADETAELVDHGASILATLTNDAWYGDTAAPWQHLRAAQFRAAENRRPLLRAAITGVSAVIEPDGALRASLGPGEEGVLSGSVRGRTDRSPYSRAPWGPVWASLGILAVAILRHP